MLSLYLHIPFCARRCPYCDFAIALDDRFRDYAEALVREIRGKGKGQPVATIHLGGGTPSRMPTDLLAGILAAVRESFEVSGDAEVALEMNPEDLGRAVAWRTMGVNRLSMGAQSLEDGELRLLGREHTAAQVAEAVREARAAGFGNLSLDLMYGIPGQTRDAWERTLARALSLSPEHVSVYALEGTRGLGLAGLPLEAAQAEMAMDAMSRLEAAGFRQYEISNFARPGFESRHNLAYWTGKPYLGLGMSAHSFLPPRRFANTSDLSEYLKREDPTAFEETLTPEQAVLERLFLGLRLAEGVDTGILKEGIGQDLEAEGLLAIEAGRVRLTPKGRVVADAVTGRLVLGVRE